MDSPGLSPNELRVILADVAGAIVLAGDLPVRSSRYRPGLAQCRCRREAGERVESSWVTGAGGLRWRHRRRGELDVEL